MEVVGPNVPPALAPLLRDLRAAILELQQPTKPGRVYAVLLEANLPPAVNHKDCVALVEGDNTLAISTNVAGTWTWLRADGSAI